MRDTKGSGEEAGQHWAGLGEHPSGQVPGPAGLGAALEEVGRLLGFDGAAPSTCQQERCPRATAADVLCPAHLPWGLPSWTQKPDPTQDVQSGGTAAAEKW